MNCVNVNLTVNLSDYSGLARNCFPFDKGKKMVKKWCHPDTTWLKNVLSLEGLKLLFCKLVSITRYPSKSETSIGGIHLVTNCVVGMVAGSTLITFIFLRYRAFLRLPASKITTLFPIYP